MPAKTLQPVTPPDRAGLFPLTPALVRRLFDEHESRTENPVPRDTDGTVKSTA